MTLQRDDISPEIPRQNIFRLSLASRSGDGKHPRGVRDRRGQVEWVLQLLSCQSSIWYDTTSTLHSIQFSALNTSLRLRFLLVFLLFTARGTRVTDRCDAMVPEILPLPSNKRPTRTSFHHSTVHRQRTGTCSNMRWVCVFWVRKYAHATQVEGDQPGYSIINAATVAWHQRNADERKNWQSSLEKAFVREWGGRRWLKVPLLLPETTYYSDSEQWQALIDRQGHAFCVQTTTRSSSSSTATTAFQSSAIQQPR